MNAFPAHLCWAEVTHAYAQGLAEGIPASPCGTKGLPGIINHHFSEQLIYMGMCKDGIEGKTLLHFIRREHCFKEPSSALRKEEFHIDLHDQRDFCTCNVLPWGVWPTERLVYAINSA